MNNDYESIEEMKHAEEMIKNVILFLEENEQYGDDWSEEIKELKKLISVTVWASVSYGAGRGRSP